MKLLITGASGLLGSDLVRTLSGRYEIMGWTRRPPDGHSIAWESVDLTDPVKVRESIRRWKPDAVLHAAAMTDVDEGERHPDQAMRVNRDGTAAVAAACAQVGAFLVAVSTDYVFDGTLNRPYREEDPPRPIGHYGRSKQAAEEAARAGCPKVLVVRVSGLFGRSRENFVSMAAARFKTGQRVSAVTDQVYSPSYTLDLAEAFARVVALYEREPDSAGPGGRLQGFLHVANSGGGSRLEVAQWIARQLGAPESLIHRCVWPELNRPAARPAQTVLDCSRYSALVGAPLRSWKEAVRDFLEAA